MTCTALTGTLIQTTTALAAPPSKSEQSHGSPGPTGRIADPDKKLGTGWKTSKDRAVTAAADSTGLRILVADSGRAYAWKTVASLSEPGMPADSWIGNQCVIDHDHAAVVYAPRTFTNKPDLMQGGAFTAIVNLGTGQVTKLPFTASLAYFDPSCNPRTHTAAFTAFRDMNDPAATRTRVVTVNTAGKTLSEPTSKGEITSAVPVDDGAVGALGPHLIHLDRKGHVKDLLTAGGVPFDIHPVDDGKVAFVERDGSKRARARVWSKKGEATVVASGRLGDLDLARGGSSQVFLAGHPSGAVHTSGSGITRIDAPVDTDISSLGRLAVNPVLSQGLRAGVDRIKNAGKGFTKTEPEARGTEQAPGMLNAAPALTVTSTATSTGTKLDQTVPSTLPTAGNQLSPALASVPKARAAAGTVAGTHSPLTRATAANVSHDPTDPDRWCSVSRNDVNAQALQPTPNQVEWAVDMAIRGDLHASYLNQGGYRNQTGMGTIDPQGLFKAPTLTGPANARIPANVMLGIMAQESNLWQAESGSIPGQMGSPLAAVDGYYGHQIDPGSPDSYWNINWDKSDCGYGVGQVTDGMRLAGHEKPGETGLSPTLQKAVAIDYATNIAASLKILADKWNEVHTAGQKITVNNDDPAYVENWFTAVWNYNLGFNPPSDSSQHGGHWGLGWYNNPANPIYKNSWGHPFMDTDVDGTDANHDAAHPQDWPYEEKVMGWAAWSIDTGYSYATSGRQDWPNESGFSSAGFRPAWWNTTAVRSQVSPPLTAFCNSDNNCDPATPPNCGTEECYTQFWFNKPNTAWKTNCATECGHELIKYQTLIPEPGRGYRLKNGTPLCSGEPTGAHVVASVPNGTETWSDCGQAISSGSFQFTFYPSTTGLHYEAKADLHQVGGGFGGHFWYTHTRNESHLGGPGGLMDIDGTWTLGEQMDLAQVWVHVPDTGAQTTRAHYVVNGASGGPYSRYVNQNANSGKWVSLGAYKFTGTPSVSLSNYTPDGSADKDIAFGAVAFQPVTGTFVRRTLTAAAIFDPNQELNQNFPVSTEFDTPLRSMKSLYEWALGLAAGGHLWDNDDPSVRTEGLTSWNPCTDRVDENCTGRQTYDAANQWAEDIKAGGYTPNADGSAPSMSIPVWMGMSNLRPDPSLPASEAYKSDNSYKIKSDIVVTFVTDGSGKIIPGSEGANYTARVGNAHLPYFVTSIMKGIEADYGIPKPYIDYTTQDALEYGNVLTSHPYTDGDTPGQAFFPHFRDAHLNTDHTCVDVRAVGGGVHGYRAMVGNNYINDNVKAWVDKINSSPDTNYAVRKFAGDIYSMFFKNSGDWNNNMWGTMIGNAPPIWQDIAAAFCADGTVKPNHLQDDRDATPTNGIVYQSYMPDLYLYVDDRMTDNLGHPSNARIRGGDWRDFSNLPIPGESGNAYGSCDASGRGSGGNPWGVQPPVPLYGDGPGNRPTSVIHCDDSGTKFTDNLTP
ncbi:hypothetical protein [Streptomyces sp. LaBMicrA B280]|uniref:golvesin C-terminal-like domain-containing protein n=1 Tax=Streptomyces sp. LaBMicrA B280 TaxID=3391001 RepID=UPI003BA75094